MSDIFNVNLPLELPKREYEQAYFFRLINQLRLNFATIQTSNETANPVEAMDWFLA